MSKASVIERNLQAIEASTLAIAEELNWFTPTQVEEVPDKPGWKRITPDKIVLPDAKEHQMQIDKGLGFVVAQVSYNKPERVFNVFLKAMDSVGLRPENYEAFTNEFRQFCTRFRFEFEKEQ